MTTTETFDFFFFNDTATTEIYTLSLHDALPILPQAPDNNQGPWVQLEEYSRDLARRGNELYITSGVIGSRGTLPKDRKSTRLNSSHANISYAVFCLKKKKKTSICSSYRSPHHTS